jgi:hypothetical protein
VHFDGVWVCVTQIVLHLTHSKRPLEHGQCDGRLPSHIQLLGSKSEENPKCSSGNLQEAVREAAFPVLLVLGVAQFLMPGKVGNKRKPRKKGFNNNCQPPLGKSGVRRRLVGPCCAEGLWQEGGKLGAGGSTAVMGWTQEPMGRLGKGGSSCRP